MVERVTVVRLSERIHRVGSHRAKAVGDQLRMAFAFARGDREGAADGCLLPEALFEAGEGVSGVSGDDDRRFELRPVDSAFFPGERIGDAPFVE